MHPLAARIEAIERRLIQRRRVEVACRIAAIVLGVAFVLSLLDYLFRPSDTGLRVMSTVLLVAAGLWALDRWWFRPKERSPSSLSVARSIEKQFPQLGDSLASAIEFLRQSEDDPTAGSPQLRRLVIAETESTVERLPIEQVIDRQPLKAALTFAAVAGAVIAVCLIMDARSTGIAFARLLSPFGGPSWPRQHYLEFRNPPTRLAVGQKFEAELVDQSGPPPQDVRIEYRWREEDGSRQTLAESPTPIGDTFLARRENVRRPFSFRATGGDDRAMRWIDVDVVEPPQVESMTVTVHPPAYTGQPPQAGERILEILAGSRIEVDGVANGPLASVRVVNDHGDPLTGEIAKPNRFQVAGDRWIPTASGQYDLELTSADGVAGIAATWRLRVQSDLPPTVVWRRPAEDLFVLPSATIPVEVFAKDDIGVKSITLEYERAMAGPSQQEQGPPANGHVALFTSNEPNGESTGETRFVEHAWPLASLGLKPGDQVTLRAEASDFRPATGSVPTARRLSIITIEELDARLADEQRQVALQLERALAAQQSARDEVRRLAARLQQAGVLASGDRNALQTAELSQRRIAWMLADEREGLPVQVHKVLDHLAMNAVASPAVEQAMASLRSALSALAAGPLSAAEGELTTARKTADLSAEHPNGNNAADADGPLRRSLATVATAQDEVIAVVERLVAELSDAADFSRFVRELSQLHSDQVAHERSTRAGIQLTTLPLAFDELSRDQRAILASASSSQEALGKRFEKSLLGTRRMSDSLDLQDASASNLLKDAVGLADRLAIATNMQNAARSISANRVATALELERQSADGLQQVLDLLRKRGPNDAERLNEIRRAEDELAVLREKLAQVREQAARPNAQTNPADRERVARAQQDLRKQIEQLARQLERLRASGASASTQQAANSLNPPNGAQNPNRLDQPAQPAADNQMQQADEKLADAERELAEERARAELDLALEFINRFRAELEKMIERQEQVVASTAEIETSRRSRTIDPAAAAERLTKLAEEERALQQLTLEQRELLFGLAAVRVSLQDADDKLADAAELLAKDESGERTQSTERLALARLEAMMRAFTETAREAQPPPGGNRGGGNNNPPPQPQRRPAFELLEVKMLRVMQLELNARTESHERRRADAGNALTQETRVELAREAQELAAEQRRLAELVQEMLSRNNRRGNE